MSTGFSENPCLTQIQWKRWGNTSNVDLWPRHTHAPVSIYSIHRWAHSCTHLYRHTYTTHRHTQRFKQAIAQQGDNYYSIFQKCSTLDVFTQNKWKISKETDKTNLIQLLYKIHFQKICQYNMYTCPHICSIYLFLYIYGNAYTTGHVQKPEDSL